MRADNPRISARANESLAKRAASLAMKKRIFIIGSVILVSVIILLCSTVLTFAKSGNEDRVLEKEYVSIEIKSGDSLWSIAETYTDTYDIELNDYIKEVESINGLTSDKIHAGEHIIVPQYHYSL